MSNEIKGLVFDIQRFSLHDGPGIRTTVFLKGCPLDCLWCHNPESKSFKPQVSYNASLCSNCMSCVSVCSSGAHKNLNGKHIFDFTKCSTTCGDCAKACAYGALKVIGRHMTADEVLTEILPDFDYYINSGGGITLSGGEPMAQFDFTLEILKKCRAHGIHTSIETCGVTTRDRLKKIMPYTDLFLYDYKATEEQVHKELTGSGNRNILSNLDFLYTNGARIVLRCPLIPGINDDEEHLRAIADMGKKYPLLSAIEIMPYHNIGNSKAENLGEIPALKELKSTDSEKKQRWAELLNLFECSNVKIN